MSSTLNKSEEKNKVVFTPDQQKCIDARNCDLLVSAAAGSGKTAVLVERIIQLICDPKNPVDIDRILVVTFTKAAASQMREKIAKAIAKKLADNPGEEHLERQAALVHNAQITTIDSFCLFVVRNNFTDIGLDPGFRVGDEGEMKLLQRDVLNELLENLYEQGEEDFLYLSDAFLKGINNDKIVDVVLKLYNTAMSYPWPEKWLDERCHDYDSDSKIEDAKWYDLLLEEVTARLQIAKGCLLSCKQLIEEPDGPYKYGALVESEIEQIQKVMEKMDTRPTYPELQGFINGITFKTLPRMQDSSVNAEKKEAAQAHRKDAKEHISALTLRYLAFSESRIHEQTVICERLLKELVHVTKLFMEAFTNAKRERNILDFSDIEHLALQILIKPTGEGDAFECTNTAEEYQNYFKYVMIDEYQDSNFVQEYLLSSIAGQTEGSFNRFMVGDVKQSIYKFRLARPDIFLEKYRTYKNDDSNHLRVDLQQNFRSRKEVLDTVNDLFGKLMYKEFGGIDYDEDAALHLGAKYPEVQGNEMKTEVLVFSPQKEHYKAIEEEAYGVALKINEMMKNFRVTDEKTGELRDIQYKDIVILLRSLKGNESVFVSTLAEHGIPAYVSSRTGYFDAYEVRVLLNLLRIIANPIQDIPLYGVLHSVIANMTDNEIALIKGNSKKGKNKRALYDDCRDWLAKAEEITADNDDECNADYASVAASAKDKLSSFLETLDLLRSYSEYMSVQELLQVILKITDYRIKIAAMPGGDRRLANIEMLLQKAADFEQTSFFGVYDFVRYMEQLRKYAVDFGEASTLGEQDDVVRIMTIHSSKGLEFPVCFLAGTAKQIINPANSSNFIIDTDLGIGMECIDNNRRTKSETLRSDILRQKGRNDDLAEELRILYVALTRTKEKLIITGAYDMRDKKQGLAFANNALVEDRICQKQEGTGHLPRECFVIAKSIMDWILLAHDSESPFSVDIIETDRQLMQESIEVMNRNVLWDKLQHGVDVEDTEMLAALERVRNQTYHHEHLRHLYTKTSVSELKAAAMQETAEEAHDMFAQNEAKVYIPAFAKEEEKEVTGTTRGNAYHKFMELFQFELLLKEEPSYEMIEKEIARTLEIGLLAEEYAEVLNKKKILAFLKSSSARRMAHAAAQGKLFREQPFVMGLPASMLDEKFPDDETVLIQGIIDVFWEEDGKIVLLDYKTDRVNSGEELIARYKTQMDYYKEALDKMKGQVSERILYSFGLLEEIVVE